MILYQRTEVKACRPAVCIMAGYCVIILQVGIYKLDLFCNFIKDFYAHTLRGRAFRFALVCPYVCPDEKTFIWYFCSKIVSNTNNPTILTEWIEFTVIYCSQYPISVLLFAHPSICLYIWKFCDKGRKVGASFCVLWTHFCLDFIKNKSVGQILDFDIL